MMDIALQLVHVAILETFHKGVTRAIVTLSAAVWPIYVTPDSIWSEEPTVIAKLTARGHPKNYPSASVSSFHLLHIDIPHVELASRPTYWFHSFNRTENGLTFVVHWIRNDEHCCSKTEKKRPTSRQKCDKKRSLENTQMPRDWVQATGP